MVGEASRLRACRGRRSPTRVDPVRTTLDVTSAPPVSEGRRDGGRYARASLRRSPDDGRPVPSRRFDGASHARVGDCSQRSSAAAEAARGGDDGRRNAAARRPSSDCGSDRDPTADVVSHDVCGGRSRFRRGDESDAAPTDDRVRAPRTSATARRSTVEPDRGTVTDSVSESSRLHSAMSEAATTTIVRDRRPSAIDHTPTAASRSPVYARERYCPPGRRRTGPAERLRRSRSPARVRPSSRACVVGDPPSTCKLYSDIQN